MNWSIFANIILLCGHSSSTHCIQLTFSAITCQPVAVLWVITCWDDFYANFYPPENPRFPIMTSPSWTRMTRNLSISKYLTVLTFVIGSYETSATYSLTISHWNNVHGYLYPSREFGGGVAGLVAGLNQIQSQSQFPQNHIRLSPGDWLGPENGWLSFFTFLENEEIKNKYFQLLKTLHDTHLNPTAVSATWSDIRFGVEMIAKTVGGSPVSRHNYSIEEPIPNLLIGNLDHPRPFQVKIWDPWKIHAIKDETGRVGYIGILGFMPPPPQNSRTFPPLGVKDVIKSLQNSVETVKSESGSKIISFIAIGDCDPKLCRDILDAVPNIRVLISGASLNFGGKGSHIIHKNGGIIASAGWGGASLGNIQLEVDSTTGNFQTIHVTLLPNTFDPDPLTLNTLTTMMDLVRLNSTAEHVLGRTEFPIGRTEFPIVCNKGRLHSVFKENTEMSENFETTCLLGNIVADAFSRCVDRAEVLSSHYNSDLHGVTSPIMAMWHSAGLTNREINISAFEDIRELDVHAWVPFLDSAKLHRIKGHQLSQFFRTHKTNLHVSEHLRVHFKGSVLKGIYHSGGSGDRMREVTPDEDLLMLMPSFLNFNQSTHSYETKPIDLDVRCLTSLFKEVRTLTWGGTGRITISLPEQQTNWWPITILAIGTALILLGLLFVMKRQRIRGTSREGNHPRFNSSSSIWPLINIHREQMRGAREPGSALEREPFTLL